MDRLGHASLLCTLLLSALRVCSGTVKVEVTPIIEVLKGETALLPCKFTVTPPSSNSVVEWYIDGVDNNRKRVAFRAQDGSSATIDKDSPMFERVTMGDDFSLSIASAMPTDERNFYCGVNALVSGTGEDTTMLKVFYAPEAPVLTKAASQAITADAADSSEIGECVTKNGLPQPRIIWFKDDKPLPEVKDSKEKTYMIPGVTKEASGMYTIKSKLYMQPTKADKDSVFHCMVEFSMPGKVMDKKKSNTITISLTYPSETATFTLVNTGPIKEGDTVTMKCETDGNPQPEFEFTKDGKTPVLGEGGLLVLKSVKRTDVGVYKCEATDFDNIDADLTGEINLSKISFIDPVTVTPAGPLSAKLGDMVEMQCTTKASEAPTVQWKKASKVIAGSSKGTLSLKSVTYDDAGEYECVGEVTTVPGLTAMASVNLTVIGKPMIDTPVNGEVMKEGDAVTLKCSAHGNPAPQFTWKPSGKESVEVQGNMVVSTVTLDASADVMASGVICETTNEHGTDSKTFTVAIKQVVEPRNGDNIENVAGQTGSGSSGVVIAVVVCVLLLLLLVALIYFLNKKGKLPCSKKDKKDMATGEVNNHGDIVVEMKTENPNEEAGLLKRPVNEQ